MGVWLLVVAGFTSCTTEPDLDRVPVVSYNNDVKRILSSNCNFQGCHGGAQAEEGSLEDYDGVMAYVKAGDARASTLYKVMTLKGIVSRRMPPAGYEEVPAQDLKKIYWWIEQGAPNN